MGTAGRAAEHALHWQAAQHSTAPPSAPLLGLVAGARRPQVPVERTRQAGGVELEQVGGGAAQGGRKAGARQTAALHRGALQLVQQEVGRGVGCSRGEGGRGCREQL